MVAEGWPIGHPSDIFSFSL